MSTNAVSAAATRRYEAVPIEPILFGAQLVVAGWVWATELNPLLGFGIFVGAVLRLVLPNSRYLAATIVLAPILFALDRYNAPLAYETYGYRQIFGAGAGLYLALLFTATFGRPKIRLWPTDVALVVLFGLLLLSLGYPDADTRAPAMFASNTLPLLAAYFAARRVTGSGTDLVLDAIVAATAIAVIGRWYLEGPGVSANIYRAGTNWYLGAAVYGALPLLLGWALAFPTLLRIKQETGKLRNLGRLAALALISAELAFLQVKTVFVVVALCAFVFWRLAKPKNRDDAVASRMTIQKIFIAILLFILATFVYSILNERIGTLYTSFWGNASDQLRLTSMLEHSRLVLDRPFGYGFSGLVESALPQSAQTSHNAFIDVAGDAGLVAAIALAFTFVSIWWVVLRRRYSLVVYSAEWWTWTRLALGTTAVIATILINGSTLYREFPIPSAALAFLFIGLAISWCTRPEHPSMAPR
jgi:hypothetical protein